MSKIWLKKSKLKTQSSCSLRLLNSEDWTYFTYLYFSFKWGENVFRSGQESNVVQEQNIHKGMFGTQWNSKKSE
jgi:hypothetical protein